jgi:aflatoxin B1 aldehyde reductase
MAEVALRWISHHSLMRREHGDSVLIGASSLNHIEQVRNDRYLLIQN